MDPKRFKALKKKIVDTITSYNSISILPHLDANQILNPVLDTFELSDSEFLELLNIYKTDRHLVSNIRRTGSFSYTSDFFEMILLFLVEKSEKNTERFFLTLDVIASLCRMELDEDYNGDRCYNMLDFPGNDPTPTSYDVSETPICQLVRFVRYYRFDKKDQDRLEVFLEEHPELSMTYYGPKKDKMFFDPLIYPIVSSDFIKRNADKIIFNEIIDMSIPILQDRDVLDVLFKKTLASNINYVKETLTGIKDQFTIDENELEAMILEYTIK